MFSKKKQKKKTDPQLDNLLEPFQEVIDEAIDLNWAELDDEDFNLKNVDYDKSTASQAVAFVIRASRRGVVPLCAEVAHLLKERNRLESLVEEQSQEILHLMDNQAVPRSPVPPPPEMFDFCCQTVQDMSAQTIELVDHAMQSEAILLDCTRELHLSEDGVREPPMPSDLTGVQFTCGKSFAVSCLCPSSETRSTQNPSKFSIGVNTSSQERLESTLGYEGHRNLESKHKKLQNDFNATKEKTKEMNVQNKSLVEDLGVAKKEIVSLQKVIQDIQNKEYERVQEEKAKINETFSVQAEHDVDDISSFEDDVTNADLRKLNKRAFLPVVATPRQQDTRKPVKTFPGPIFGCKCFMCETFFKSSGLLGFASSPYITDSSGRNPVLKDIKKLLYLQSSKLQVRQNDHVIIKGNSLGVVRYVGHLDGLGSSSTVYMGVELENATGKHDGHFGGKRYFCCQHKHGLFVPLQDLLCIVNRQLSLPGQNRPRQIRTALPQVTGKKSIRKDRKGRSSSSETSSNTSTSMRVLKTR